MKTDTRRKLYTYYYQNRSVYVQTGIDLYICWSVDNQLLVSISYGLSTHVNRDFYLSNTGNKLCLIKLLINSKKE